MRQLGRLEAVVMDRLWSAQGPMTVREVLEDLRPGRALAYTTVMTVMDNLHNKGILRRERQGRAYLYRPAQTREEHTAALMEQVLASSGDPGATLMRFVGQLPPEDLARLRDAVRSLERRRGSQP